MKNKKKAGALLLTTSLASMAAGTAQTNVTSAGFMQWIKSVKNFSFLTVTSACATATAALVATLEQSSARPVMNDLASIHWIAACILAAYTAKNAIEEISKENSNKNLNRIKSKDLNKNDSSKLHKFTKNFFLSDDTYLSALLVAAAKSYDTVAKNISPDTYLGFILKYLPKVLWAAAGVRAVGTVGDVFDVDVQNNRISEENLNKNSNENVNKKEKAASSFAVGMVNDVANVDVQNNRIGEENLNKNSNENENKNERAASSFAVGMVNDVANVDVQNNRIGEKNLNKNSNENENKKKEDNRIHYKKRRKIIKEY